MGVFSSKERELSASVSVDTGKECPFETPVTICIDFGTDTSCDHPVAWRVQYEVDIAYAQTMHTVLELQALPFEQKVELHVEKETFLSVREQTCDAENALCNISTMHVQMMKNTLEGPILFETVLVVDVFRQDAKEKVMAGPLRRRIYAPLKRVEGQT